MNLRRAGNNLMRISRNDPKIAEQMLLYEISKESLNLQIMQIYDVETRIADIFDSENAIIDKVALHDKITNLDSGIHNLIDLNFLDLSQTMCKCSVLVKDAERYLLIYYIHHKATIEEALYQINELRLFIREWSSEIENIEQMLPDICELVLNVLRIVEYRVRIRAINDIFDELLRVPSFKNARERIHLERLKLLYGHRDITGSPNDIPHLYESDDGVSSIWGNFLGSQVNTSFMELQNHTDIIETCTEIAFCNSNKTLEPEDRYLVCLNMFRSLYLTSKHATAIDFGFEVLNSEHLSQNRKYPGLKIFKQVAHWGNHDSLYEWVVRSLLDLCVMHNRLDEAIEIYDNHIAPNINDNFWKYIDKIIQLEQLFFVSHVSSANPSLSDLECATDFFKDNMNPQVLDTEKAFVVQFMIIEKDVPDWYSLLKSELSKLNKNNDDILLSVKTFVENLLLVLFFKKEIHKLRSMLNIYQNSFNDTEGFTARIVGLLDIDDSRIKKDLGTSWDDLETETKKLLALADHTFNALGQDPQINDYSPAIITYCKAVEGELKAKWGKYFDKELLGNASKQAGITFKDLTLGNFTHLYRKHYSSFMKSITKHYRSGIKGNKIAQMMKKIDTPVRDPYRNHSAHSFSSESFNATDAEKLRNILVNETDGLLRMIVDDYKSKH